ncbi:MAG TPA: thioredoxin-like domain-containing protein [Planctomycetota bacterium]|nr:thioredoxin-like domain-containing protein [Planctomycetota bacterium]
MLPHEKTLVKRLANEPFALIGMNTDSDKVEELTKRFKDDGLNWRHAMLGAPNKAEIPAKWNVRGYPTLYLLDAQGVIRNYWLGSPGDEVIDKEVDALVAEAKSKK